MGKAGVLTSGLAVFGSAQCVARFARHLHIRVISGRESASQICASQIYITKQTPGTLAPRCIDAHTSGNLFISQNRPPMSIARSQNRPPMSIARSQNRPPMAAKNQKRPPMAELSAKIGLQWHLSTAPPKVDFGKPQVESSYVIPTYQT